MNLTRAFSLACAIAVFVPHPHGALSQNLSSQGPRTVLQGSLANDTARYLAGMPVDKASPIAPLANEPASKNHAAMIGEAFNRFEADRLAKLKEWAPVALAGVFDSSAPLFYMFSGPDFLYATHLFPSASTMVLCGLEPVGNLPDLAVMDPASRHKGLAQLRASLQAILSFSFFKTKDMKTDLRGHSFEGTAPLLLCFLARSGREVIEARLALLDQDGALFDYQPDHAADRRRFVQGVRFTYYNPSNPRPVSQTLFYFTADISDSGLARHAGLLKLCSSLGRGNAFVKSASYLMHESYFSTIRRFLIEHSDNLLQDDSGIPLKFFDGDWAIRLFGSYPGPIDLFKDKYQPDLAALYKKTIAAPLEFGIGYRHRPGTSTLMLATRGAALPPASPDDPPSVPETPEVLPPIEPLSRSGGTPLGKTN